MSGLRQFNDYKNYSFFFKKFDTLESFKEAGEKAIEDFLASGKPKGEYSYFDNYREVFVGTLATIYSVGSAGEGENIETIKTKMANETYADGTKVFTLASGISLLLFYAFAMQCMSTLAIVRRETKTWKWPILQLLGMTAIAYVCALIAFQILK